MTTRRVFCALLPAAALGRPLDQQSVNKFDKPPADVDDALRARVTDFYNFHKTGKYRLAEQLVAEDSKDGFYSAGKPDVKDFKISEITYSDNYTKAKITIVAKMLMTFMGLGSQLMDTPFPSYWKIDGGKWCWYIYNDPNRLTPFGKISPKTGQDASDPSLAFKPVDMSTVTNGVKADRRVVTLGTAEERVELTNQLPGPVTLELDQKEYQGLAATINKQILKGGETATLTIKPTSSAKRVRLFVGILVKPTNQLVQVEIK